MKIKVEYLILVAVIVLLSLYLLLHKTDKTHYQLPALPSLTADDLSKLEVIQPERTLSLVRAGDRWEISPQGYPVTASRIQDMLKALEGLTLTAMVSESKNYERYDLQADKRIRVQAWSGDNLKRDIEIGKAASSFRHTFLKLAGDDRVYHARENFRPKFEQTIESLHDKQVLTFEVDTIQAIQLTHGDTLTEITRAQPPVAITPDKQDQPAADQPTGPLWQTTDGIALDDAKVKNLLNTLSRLSCDNYIYDRSKAEMQGPIFSIVLKGPQEYTLVLFAPQDLEAGPFPALSSENKYPFLLPEHRVKNIMMPLDDLKKNQDAS